MTDQDQRLGPAALTRKLIRAEPERARELLDALPLSERAAIVASRYGRERLDLILLSAEAQELVQALPAPELWITIKEVGEEEAVELLRLAAPAQIQHLTDLEWWHQGTLDPLAAAYWLMLLSEAGSEAAVEWFRQADEELLVTTMAKFFRVFKPDPDLSGADPWRDQPNLFTLDDAYFLQFFDPNAAPILARFLSFIRAEEPERYYGLLDMVELTVLIEQEQAAHDFRMARLADFGFVDFDEAIGIYAPLSDAELARLLSESRPPAPAPVAAPAFPLATAALPPLFGRALAQIGDPRALSELALGMGALVNRILIADALDLTQLESVSRALGKAQNFVEIGLGRVSGGEIDRAVEALTNLHPFILFRAGYTRPVELARRADRLLRAGWPARFRARPGFLGDDGLLLEGLLRPRPQFYAGADDRGAPLYREFQSAAEIERAAAALLRVNALGLVFFEVMQGSEADLSRLADFRVGAEVPWWTVLLTATAQALAGNEVRFAPLTLADARLALELLLTEARPRTVRPEIRAALVTRAEAGLRRLASAGEAEAVLGGELVAEALAKLEAEAAEFSLPDLDPRFFGAMIVLPE